MVTLNILMLGGTGYLGSKVAKRLLKDGHNVTCTKRASSDLSRIQSTKVNWIPASIDAIETATRYQNFDFVLNMVCNYGRSNVLYDNVVEANLEFPLKALNQAVEQGIKNFMTIGTGLPDELNMYSFSKKMFSDAGRFYVDKHDINFYNMRLEMFYGADEPTNRFLPSVIYNMINGNEVNTTLGTQKRDIIAADDIVEAIIMVMNSNLKGYQEISVGTGEAPTISEVIEFIWDETGNSSKWNRGTVPMRANEPDCVADITILKSIGEWNPVDWRTGIHNMIADMKNNIGG